MFYKFLELDSTSPEKFIFITNFLCKWVNLNPQIYLPCSIMGETNFLQALMAPEYWEELE